MNSILIDTNILVYAIDPEDVAKQEMAIRIITAVQATSKGCLSAQCLGEFSAVCVRRLKALLTPQETEQQVEHLAQAFAVFPLTELIIKEALRGVRDYQFAYYDAQIWAAARLHQISVLFSEDFNPGVYGGVRVVNPFAPAFVLEDWL
jgi:predicted nucleic acid-binding protein